MAIQLVAASNEYFHCYLNTTTKPSCSLYLLTFSMVWLTESSNIHTSTMCFSKKLSHIALFYVMLYFGTDLCSPLLSDLIPFVFSAKFSAYKIRTIPSFSVQNFSADIPHFEISSFFSADKLHFEIRIFPSFSVQNLSTTDKPHFEIRIIPSFSVLSIQY